MIVVGTDRAMMAAAAANRLGEVSSVTVGKDGAELALVELPIAGLMSNGPAAENWRQPTAWWRRWPHAGLR
jgi:adenine deaminase